MKIKAELTNTSISKLVSNKDFKDCICEYIWNGFDAGATKVNLSFTENELGGISQITIKDNGNGIVYEDLDKTFKCVLDSKKSMDKKYNNIHGSKGKGRFSFINFAEQAIWETIYKNDSNINEKYKIEIIKSTSSEFELSDKIITKDNTGTVVTISGIVSIHKDNIESKKFQNYLKDKFAWYLYLNKNNGYEITINGVELDYMDIIDEKLSKELSIEIHENKFEINFIKWCGKIKEKYYSYFMNNEYLQIYKKTTSYNNKKLEFPHSIYVKSDYFNGFKVISEKVNTIENQISLENEKNQKDKIFKELDKFIKQIINSQIKEYSKIQAPKIIEKLEKEGTFPKFNGKYGLLKKDDLKEVLTEICAVQPKIFQGSIENKKSIVGFLNLLLDTDEREGIINIMDNIVSLTPEERIELNDVLRKTTLSRIIRTVSAIQNRLKVIEALKKLVHDETIFTNERDHIQKIIENNYWLFGEQYHLASADENFERALESYTYIIDGYKSEKAYKIDNPERLRRPDIFMCRSRSIYSENLTELEENIIVELKAPSVILNKNIYRQIEDYMLLISKEGRFNSEIRRWKFIIVSEKVDEDIISLYDDWKDKGKRFLVKGGNKFEIYAMTWDDVFKNFELNHKYILKKLEFDKVIIKEEVDKMSDEEGRALVDEITNKIIQIENIL